jgi:pilus assembly protein Flp/PilA
MRRLLTLAKKFLTEESGPTAVEYAVMLALIIIVCFVAIGLVGQKTSQNFSIVAWTIGAS